MKRLVSGKRGILDNARYVKTGKNEYLYECPKHGVFTESLEKGETVKALHCPVGRCKN